APLRRLLLGAVQRGPSVAGTHETGRTAWAVHDRTGAGHRLEPLRGADPRRRHRAREPGRAIAASRAAHGTLRHRRGRARGPAGLCLARRTDQNTRPVAAGRPGRHVGHGRPVDHRRSHDPDRAGPPAAILAGRSLARLADPADHPLLIKVHPAARVPSRVTTLKIRGRLYNVIPLITTKDMRSAG